MRSVFKRIDQLQRAKLVSGRPQWLEFYPPFAFAGAPNPISSFHDHTLYSKEEQKALLRTAHGPGNDRLLSYRLEGEDRPEKDPWRDLVTIVKRGVRWTAKWAKIGWEHKSAIGDIILNTIGSPICATRPWARKVR